MDLSIDDEDSYNNYLKLIEGSDVEILMWNFDGREISSLPTGLTKLYCNSNRLTELPPLPTGLTHLYCNSNQLTSLPPLPTGLTHICCGDNYLTNLPPLPTGLTELYCYDNPFLYFPLDIPKFNISRNVNKIPILRRIQKKYRNKLINRRKNKLSFLPLPFALIGLICEY